MDNESGSPVRDITHSFGFDDLYDIHNNWIKFVETLKSGEYSFKWMTKIETLIPDTENEKYVTMIKLNGDIINYFPGSMNRIDNEYWRSHNARVDEVLHSRNRLFLKIFQLWKQYSNLNLNMVLSLHNIWATEKRNNVLNFFSSLISKFRSLFKV